MVTYDECAVAIEFVFDAMDLLMVVCFLAGLFLGWLIRDLSFNPGSEDSKPLNFKEKNPHR